jgi:hypothetical protein
MAILTIPVFGATQRRRDLPRGKIHKTRRLSTSNDAAVAGGFLQTIELTFGQIFESIIEDAAAGKGSRQGPAAVHG